MVSMNWTAVLFGGWEGLLRTATVGVGAYVALIVLLRVSGKRTLSKMNAFDLVVTVALGSVLATILLSKDTALAQGVLAFALLIFLQYAIAWLSVRSRVISDLVKSEPTLLLHRGEFLRSAMRAQRVLESEIRQALRSQGLDDPGQVDSVILETDGSLSVIQRKSDA